MALVLLLAAGIVALGHFMRVPWAARLNMLGLLYVAVLALHILLPDGHPLRESTGGTAEPWLIVGGLAALALGYRAILRRVRARAQAKQAARAEPSTATAPSGPFTDDELERYARHITLPEIGGAGQRRLKEAKVLVIGAGGLGSPVLFYLGAAGVGRIGVIDDDTVALSNLQRQVIHSDDRQGMPKVFSAQQAIAALNPFVDVLPYNRALTEDIAVELFSDYDLIVDGTDTFETRALVNRAAVAAGRPLLAGAISAWEGQVTLYDPAGGAPCMACIFPEPPAPGLSRTCAETGVIGALPGVIGSMMALEAVKEITHAGEGLRGRMLIHDALTVDTRVMRIARRADCPVCGEV
ncbi:molybdopterin-synthase adenylyltransferase MoeB [Rhodobacterales bacterium HKCCE3408]|nr:molybdopterin-synthase adenylyltransferase MoeB [Rhodobacterales bacterium HKCCE3408]